MKLNLGSGIKLKKGFTNVDIIPEDKVKGKAKYVKADIRDLPFEDNSASYVEMYTVIEHIPFREVVDVLKEIRRVMKPKAKLIIVTDDFDGIMARWFRMRVNGFDIERYQDVMEGVYGNQHHEGEFHKVCMTPDFLNWCLVNAGFTVGSMTVYPQNSPIPKIGSNPERSEMVFRNDMLVAEVTK